MVLPESKIECHGPFNCSEEDSELAGHCAICGEPIYKGDAYYDLFEEMICEGCVSSGRRYA